MKIIAAPSKSSLEILVDRETGFCPAGAASSLRRITLRLYAMQLLMNSTNNLLVDYTMTELKEDSGPYERGTHWAEPNVEEAANFMRLLYEHREEGDALGARAANGVRVALNPAVTSAQIEKHVRGRS